MSIPNGSDPNPTYRVLITGSRHWTDEQAIEAALLSATANRPGKSITVVHGGASGADRLAGRLADEWGMNVEVHPAEWDKHGKAAGPIRNQKMVDLGADVCLAFPMRGSRGTKHCMEAAHRAGIPVHMYWEARP